MTESMEMGGIVSDIGTFGSIIIKPLKRHQYCTGLVYWCSRIDKRKQEDIIRKEHRVIGHGDALWRSRQVAFERFFLYLKHKRLVSVTLHKCYET